LQPCQNTANASKASGHLFSCSKLQAVVSFFMPSHLRSVNGKAGGSKVKEQLQKCESKGNAASQRTKPSQKTTA